MRLLDRVSLRSKLVLGIMLTAGFALMLALAAFLVIEMVAYRRSSLRELSVLAEVLADQATAALDFQQVDEAERMLSHLHTQHRITDAVIYDKHGQLFAAYHRDFDLPQVLADKPSFATQRIDGSSLWLTRSIHHGEDFLGTIYVRSDLSDLNRRLGWGLAMGLVITVMIGSIALLFAMRVGRLTAEPILHLAEAARRVAERRDPGERVARESRDEVGVLVDAFNRMLDQLREREARLEESQRMAHLGNWHYDSTLRSLECSDEVFRIFGLDADPGLPLIDAIRKLIRAEDYPSLESCFRRSLEHGDSFSMDLRTERPDGNLRWVHLVGEAYSNDGGHRKLRGTLMDITDRRQADAALRQAQKLESLGVLAGGIAHDFNNLLGALMGNLGLARMAVPEASPVHSHLTKAEAIAMNAANLTRQMLAYSGKGRFEVKPLDLSDVIREMGYLLSISISKRTALHYELAVGLPAVLADVSQIQQVVMNLVINASEALEDRDGSVWIRTTMVDLGDMDVKDLFAGQELATGSHVLLEVQDDGHGMDAGTLERIFDPFFTTKFAGRGLGLAAMLGIVKGHHGAIKVCSEPGKGTTFKLLFPADSKPMAKEQGMVPALQEGVMVASGLVLVVDDEPEIRSVASAILERMGFEVIQAADGVEAIDRYTENRNRVRLVLLDLTMPRMNGAECFKVLKSLDSTLPILLSSGFSERESAAAFADQGLAGFVQKPYRVSTMMDKVREILGRIGPTPVS